MGFFHEMHQFLSSEGWPSFTYKNDSPHAASFFYAQLSLEIRLYTTAYFTIVHDAAAYQKESLDAMKHGLQIIKIHQDQWQGSQGLVQSMLASQLGRSERIHARHTHLRDLTNDQLVEFLEQHHLLMPIRARYKFGLYKNKMLVAVAAFSKPRKIWRESRTYLSCELLRFCNHQGLTVVGGMGKLLRHFEKQVQPEDIMSYADLEWSQGAVYRTLGFQEVGTTAPHFFTIHPTTGMRQYADAGALKTTIGRPPGIVCNAGNLKFVKFLK
jgi:hypothetical protein